MDHLEICRQQQLSMQQHCSVTSIGCKEPLKSHLLPKYQEKGLLNRALRTTLQRYTFVLVPVFPGVVRFCSESDIAAAKQAAAGTSDGGKLAWDTPKQEEDISKQTQHAKVTACNTLCVAIGVTVQSN